MKNFILILLLVSFPFILLSQNKKALDKKYGFRDLKFETPFDSLSNKNLVTIGPNYFKSSNEDLKMGEYVLDEIIYGFYNGQLYSIIITTKGIVNSRGFLKIIEEGYGRGYKGNPYIEQYYWFGKKVEISFNINSITYDAFIHFDCVKLRELKEFEKKQSEKDAAKKL